MCAPLNCAYTFTHSFYTTTKFNKAHNGDEQCGANKTGEFEGGGGEGKKEEAVIPGPRRQVVEVVQVEHGDTRKPKK